MRITESSLRRTIRDVIRESINEQESGEKKVIDESEAIQRIKTGWSSYKIQFRAAWERMVKKTAPSEPISLNMTYKYKINKDGTVSNASWKVKSKSENLGDVKDFVAELTKLLSSAKFCGQNEQFSQEYDINEAVIEFT